MLESAKREIELTKLCSANAWQRLCCEEGIKEEIFTKLILVS